MGRRSCTRMLRGQMETEKRCSRPRVILLVQLKAEKIPVNFLLFTGGSIPRSYKLYLRMTRSGCRFGQTNPREHDTGSSSIPPDPIGFTESIH